MKYIIKLQHKNINSQSGFVSFISVLFFVLLASVLMVGFIGIMSIEQNQVINNELAAGALDSARSGVEDAKRVVKLCDNPPNANIRNECAELYSGPDDCSEFPTKTNIVSELGLTVSGGQVVRVGNSAANQYYTCLIVHPLTVDVEQDDLIEDRPEVFHLRGESNYNRIRISWHGPNSVASGATTLPNSLAGDDNYRRPNRSASYPSVLRAQLIYFDPSANFDTAANQHRTTFLYPTSSGAGVSSPVDYGASISDDGVALKKENVRCDTSRQWVCQYTIDVPASQDRYYLHLMPLYGSTDVKVELLDRSGATPAIVRFDRVQPEVDVTGYSGDAYKRLVSRIRYESPDAYTADAIQSGTSVCKNFAVSPTAGPSSGLPDGCDH